MALIEPLPAFASRLAAPRTSMPPEPVLATTAPATRPTTMLPEPLCASTAPSRSPTSTEPDPVLASTVVRTGTVTS